MQTQSLAPFPQIDRAAENAEYFQFSCGHYIFLHLFNFVHNRIY